jgi:hypothetical protein
MAITWVSSSNTTYASRTNTTVTAPSGITDDDVMIALLFMGRGTSGMPTPTAPSGWTEIGSGSERVGSGGFYGILRAYIKVASGESGNYTWTHSALSSQGWIGVFRGVDTTTPQDTTATTNRGTTGLTRTWSGLTTATDGAWIVALGHDWADTTNNLSPPTGMTERLDVTLVYVATEEVTTAGATGDRSHTCNSSTVALSLWEGRLIALRPAAAGTTDGAAASSGSGSVSATGASIAEASAAITGSATLSVVGTTASNAPLIEAADCTESGNNTATTSWAVSRPAYSAGDLILFHVASDADVTHDWPATGPDGETIVTIADSIGGVAQRASAFYYIAGGAQSSGTLTVTPSATEQWTACVVRVPAGEFDATTPIDSSETTNANTAVTNADSPAWTGTAANGRVCVWFSTDTIAVTAAPAGWTLHATEDGGAIGGAFATRDAGTTASESIAAATFTKASDTHCSIGYVINAPSSATGGAVAVSGSATVDAVGASEAAAAASVTGSGAVAATGASFAEALAAVSGSGSVSAAGEAVTAGAAASSGAATVAATGAAIAEGAAAISGAGTVNAVAEGGSVAEGAAASSGAGTVSAGGSAVTAGAAASSGAATLAVTGASIFGGAAASSGSAALSVAGASIAAATADMAASGDVAATGASTAEASASVAGSAVVDAVGVAGGTATGSAAIAGAFGLSVVGEAYIFVEVESIRVPVWTSGGSIAVPQATTQAVDVPRRTGSRTIDVGRI